MSKLDNFNIGLMLQDIQSLYDGNVQNNIASTAGQLAAGIKKDGFDQEDLAKLMLNQSFDQDPQGVLQKIQNNVSLYYDDIEKILSKNKDWKGLIALESMLTDNPDIETFGNSLSNYFNNVSKMQGGGIVHKAGDRCGTNECAQFSNNYIRSLGWGTYGDAWHLENADLLYSGYDVNSRPEKYDENLVSKYNFDAADNLQNNFDLNTLDKNQTYAVNMFFKGSPNLKKAYNNGRDGVSGTHTGYLKFDPDTNSWKVVHNIHDKIYVDDFTNVLGSNGKWGVTAIFKPTKEHLSTFQKVSKIVRDYREAVHNTLKDLSEHPSPAFFAEGGQFETNDNWLTLYIGDKEYKVLVAISEEEKEQGLQNVESLESNEGMLFDYLDEPQKKVSFWMKDTTVALDIVFINDKLEVECIKEGEPLSEKLLTCIPKEGSIVYVLEVPVNSDIQIGDKLTIDGKTAESEFPEDAALKILGSDGEVQAVLQGGERIFSIKNTKTLVSMAKRAYESQSDSDYKALGKKVFEYMKVQDERDPEYVE